MGAEGEQKRYALLLATTDSDYVKKMYGGYYHVFVVAFREEGEKWDLFRVVEGEFPDMGELANYDGFVVSGSPHDAYANDLWILKLCFLLQTLDAMQKRVLGICFGHQVLCRALGGKVGKAYGGWDIGIKKVSMVEDLPPRRFLDGIEDFPSSASIIEIHQDESHCLYMDLGRILQVWELPMGGEVIAFSEKTGVEMFCIEDHILGIQGHPEYSKDILYNLIDRLAANDVIESGVAEDVKASMEVAEPDQQLWRKICKNFLKGR